MEIINRVKEPSTWAGIGVLTTLLGVPSGTFQLVQQVVVGIAGLAAIFLREKAAN